MRWRNRHRSLVDLVADAVRADPGDAPAVFLEVNVFADDLERYTPTAAEPESRRPGL